MNAATGVTIVEVSPRDGLQNESVILKTSGKVDLLNRLVDAGSKRIEAVSFAHPERVPAMADAEAVMKRAPRAPGVTYAGLVLNRRGLSRALSAGMDEANFVVSVSDTFSRRNQNTSSYEALRAAGSMVEEARAQGLFTTITLATAFGCPFEGEVAGDRVVQMGVEAARSGVDELCFADTVGVGVPSQVRDLANSLRAKVGRELRLRFHFHNTRNTGLANAAAAIAQGVTTLDASSGGIGGCPFAPAATGNIATEDLVYMLERMGLSTGIDIHAMISVSAFLAKALQHEVPAMLPRAGTFPGRVEKPLSHRP